MNEEEKLEEERGDKQREEVRSLFRAMGKVDMLFTPKLIYNAGAFFLEAIWGKGSFYAQRIPGTSISLYVSDRDPKQVLGFAIDFIDDLMDKAKSALKDGKSGIEMLESLYHLDMKTLKLTEFTEKEKEQNRIGKEKIDEIFSKRNEKVKE